MKYKELRALATKFQLVLGSGSPRRLKLLSELEIAFKQSSADIHESQIPTESPSDYALRLAREKALAISANLDESHIVLGCDTIVILGKKVLEKPANDSEAFEILSSLAGKKHIVCTALAFSRGKEVLTSDYELTSVYFNPLTEKQIKDYIATGEPADKAGAYGIQGMGAILVDRIEGNLDNVVGLSLQLLERMAAVVIAERSNL